MDGFEIAQTLFTSVRFRVFEGYAKELQFPVVLKQCDYSRDEEVEFLVRSALMKAKNNTYSQPLVSIFADVDTATKKTVIVFVWRKGRVLDPEIERDQVSPFPPGKAGFDQVKVIDKGPRTTVKQAHCLTLDKKVILRVSTHMNMADMNSTFKEALAQVQCTHTNTCEFLDFRLYMTKKGQHRAYLVTEWFNQDLAQEIAQRRSSSQPYAEPELLEILLDVSAALLHAKSLQIAHRDIHPSNILRTPTGLKLSNFVPVWQKVLETPSDQDSYQTPEAWKTTSEPGSLQRYFESDVFSLGMSMLHLATLDSPPRTEGKSDEWLQEEVSALRYSDELKRLIAALLSVSPHDRPLIETVRRDAVRIQMSQADRLAQQALAKYKEEIYAEAVELHESAHAIYTRLPDEKATANNLRNWGMALENRDNFTKAEEKHIAAAAILSTFPSDEDTARNLFAWGSVLNQMRKPQQAAEKFEAAHSIYSRLPATKDTAENLSYWGYVLGLMGENTETDRVYKAAHDIYSQLSPNDKDTAYNLVWWGDALLNMGNREEGLRRCAEADSIYSSLEIGKIPVFQIRDWIHILIKMNNKDKAMMVLRTAEAHYSRHSNKWFVANTTNKWGIILSGLGNYAEAGEKYEAADAIYSRFYPSDRCTAHNLYDLGFALRVMGRRMEAIAKYETARAIFAAIEENGYADECDWQISRP